MQLRRGWAEAAAVQVAGSPGSQIEAEPAAGDVEALLDQALPLSEFFYGELSGRVNLQTSEGRAGLVQHARPLLAQISGAPVLALMLIKRLALLTSINQNRLSYLSGLKLGT